MADLIQTMFTGNPLATYVGKRIEATTSPDLETDDWASIMDIVDIINQSDDDAKDAVRAIKKRLQQIEHDTNFTITNRTLTVLEACVKNGPRRFHILVMTKEFISDLVKLIGPKNNPPNDLQERVLNLIHSWADEFRNQPELSGVVTVYNELQTKGVTFPTRDPSSMVPIQTPQRSVPPTVSRQTADQLDQQQAVATNLSLESQLPPGPVLLEGEGYNKISQDLSVVQTSVDMFNDIMKIIQVKGEESDWKLASDMNTTCRQMKDRIVDLIERVANEDLTIELLRLNDELNNIFTKYDRSVKNNSKQPGKSSTSTSIAPSGTNEPSLIDFNFDEPHATPVLDPVAPSVDRRNTPVSNQSVSSTIMEKPANGSKAVDPLAHNLNRLNLSNPTGSKVEGPSKPSAGVLDEISSVRQEDFAEIENWLSTDSGRDLASIGADLPSVEPISIGDSAFDNFIASRVMAGSSQDPKSTTTTTTSDSKQRKPDPSIL